MRCGYIDGLTIIRTLKEGKTKKIVHYRRPREIASETRTKTYWISSFSVRCVTARGISVDEPENKFNTVRPSRSQPAAPDGMDIFAKLKKCKFSATLYGYTQFVQIYTAVVVLVRLRESWPTNFARSRLTAVASGATRNKKTKPRRVSV